MNTIIRNISNVSDSYAISEFHERLSCFQMSRQSSNSIVHFMIVC